MAFSLILGLLFFLGHSAAIQCPPGSVHYTDRGECIYPVNAKTNYTEARQICQNLNGQLIQVHDIFENVVAGSQADIAIAPNSLSYIGVVKGPNGNWVYSDGTPLQYQNWRSGHPLSDASCAVISGENYQWTSISCDLSHTFICALPDQSCPTGWVQYDNMCYYFYDPQLSQRSQTFTLSQATAACQAMNANLTSIHSDEEFNFLKSQISTSNLSLSMDCGHYQAVIGLTCSDSNNYRWLDATPVDYNQSQNQCTSSYGIINDQRCSQSTYWDWWDINYQYYRYICKKRPNVTSSSKVSTK